MTCPDCEGCTDDLCPGSCGMRWCGGFYSGDGCNRCPEKVYKKTVETNSHGPKDIHVRCAGSTGHTGRHHWNPWLAER